MKDEMIKLYNWGEKVFRRAELEISDVIEKPREWSVRLRLKNPNMKLGVSMASMDKKLNLSDEEHTQMAKFLDALI